MPRTIDASTKAAHPGWRLAAGVYDTLPILALWFATGMLAVIMNGGEAIDGAARPLLFVALLAVTVGYLALSFSRGGQTLGMRAWRLRLICSDGSAPGLARAAARAALGLAQVLPAGVGLLPALFSRDRRTLADMLCGTRVLRLPE